MNSLHTFLTELHQQGVKLWVDGEQLRVNAPRGTLTPTLTDRLKAQKTELLTLLRQQQAAPRIPAIQPRPAGNQPVPLSFAQQRLWFLNRLGNPEAYNMPARLPLQGPLHHAALEQSLATIIRRHESLRTTFVTVEGEARQVIQNDVNFTLPIIDLTALSATARQAEMEAHAAREALHPFDLERDLLLRALLLRLGETEHLLLLTLHHIAGDGWSMEVLSRELATLYPAFVQGNPDPLPPLAIQYADFAQWQRQWLQGEVLAQQVAYWKQQLTGAPPLLELPTDRPRPPVQSFQGAKVAFTIPAEVTQGLRRLSRQAEATLFMTLLAAFKVLLTRYTGQRDIVVDTPIAGRNHTAIEPLIGFFVNTLVLRTELTGASTFLDLLGRVRQVTEAAFAHQDAPFEQLVEALQPERNLAYNPLSQVSFALQNRAMAPLTVAGLQVNPPTMEVQTVRADLELFLFEGDQTLSGECVYSTALFDATTIERLVGHYQTLLTAIVQNPTQLLTDLPLLTAAEQQQLLIDWNATAAPYPAERCIHQLFAEQAARTPGAVAVIAVDDKVRGWQGDKVTTDHPVTLSPPHLVILSYGELNNRANQLAHHLQALGVGPESLVGIGVSRSPAMVVALLGVLKAGGAYLPLDGHYPAERLRFMVADAQPKVLIAEADLLAKVADKMDDSQPPYHLLDLAVDWPTIAQYPTDNPVSTVDAENLAYVIYTSGSTGQPKGVMIPHRALVNHGAALVREFGLTAQDRVLQFAAFSFDVAAEEIFPTWLAGAAVVLPPAQRVWPVPDLLRLVEQEGVSVLNLPASYWHEWVLQLDQNPVPAPVRLVVVGSEKVAGARLATWQAHVGNRAIAWRNAYGLSETTITSTLYTPPIGQTTFPAAVPIGRPLANTQIYILDSAGHPAPIGVPGELYIGGAGVARGYLNRPDLTDLRFVLLDFGLNAGDEEQNPKSKITNLKFYKTGDRARYLPDGNIEFLGRADTQVKIRGFRVEPSAIESILAQHPQVADAALIDHTDPTGNQSLVAYVVVRDMESGRQGDKVTRWQGDKAETDHPVTPSPFHPVTTADLRQFLQTRVPDYMVPATMMIVEALPLLPNGKVDRRRLPAPTATPSAPTALVAPRSELETTIAAVWCEVLQRPAVGIHDNFFDLGGHSLLLLRVHHQLQARLAQPVAVVDLFQFPTISALSEHLSQDKRPQPIVSPPPPRPAAATAEGVAIIGMSCRFPGARTVAEFWQNLHDGVESLLPIPDEELLAAGVDPALVQNPHYVKRMGRLAAIDHFDAAFFGYSAREAAATDPQHRLFTECAWEALEQAGYAPHTYQAQIGGRIGVFAGSGFNSYRALHLTGNAEITRTLGDYQIAVSNEGDAMPTHVSYKLNLTGPSLAVNTACSTSLVAVHVAAQSLLRGECEMALAGGVTIHAQQAQGYLYEEGMILSPDGHCRAFDAQAQGTAAGNGAGVVLLKRLTDALADGDPIYAVIKGSAINNDGARKVGYTAPSVEGQSQVILAAQANAGVAPATISYIETHGTGTPLGDPIEIAALTQAFRQSTQERGFCAVGAVKTNIGHLDTAAGVAGLIKTALALHHKVLPPSLHFTTPNPQIDFANSPFYVNAQRAAWSTGDTPRRAGVSSFGIGGTNAHVILEEAPLPTPRPEDSPPPVEGMVTRSWQLLLLSARSAAALETMTDNLAAHLAAHPDLDLADVAYTLSVGRTLFAHRRVVLCRDTADAVCALTQRDPARVLTQVAPAKGKARPIALLFSGQGSQYVNMARALYTSEPLFRQTVDHCCELLQPHLGLDLRAVLYPDDKVTGWQGDKVTSDKVTKHSPVTLSPLHPVTPSPLHPVTLSQTALTQPALFVIEYALAKVWAAWGVEPQAMLGHSIGEYVAATLAGVFALEDALALVAARGRLMGALPGGAMVAVSLPEAALQAYLNNDLAVAAINGPERCVVAGSFSAMTALEEELSAQGIVHRRLHTSHAFHSPMMTPILADFTARVRQVQLNPPQHPYLSNVTGRRITAAEATDPAYWARHLRQAVRFGEGAATLLQDGEQVLLEVGPGRSLSQLVSQHPARQPAQVILTSLPTPQQAETTDDAAFLLTTLGQLWLHNVAVDWVAFYAGAGGQRARRRVPLPTYPFERQRYWVDAPARGEMNKVVQADGKQSNPADWFYLPTWERKPLLSQSTPALTGATLLFADECGLGEQLAVQLRGKGTPVTVVEPGTAFARLAEDRYALPPADPPAYLSLMAELQAADRLPNRIVHLWSVTATPSDDDLTGAVQSQTQGFNSLLALAQALGQQAPTQRCHLLVVSTNMQEVAGEPWLAPTKATLLGPVLVIPQEFANLTTQSVDLLLPTSAWQRTQLLNQLQQELAHGGESGAAERVVAYRGQHRWVRSFAPTPLAAFNESPVQFRQNGVYLITGGLGGIGLALADYLARTVQAKLVLTGRSAFPPRAQWTDWLQSHAAADRTSRQLRQLQALEALGAEILVASADVADLTEMQGVIALAMTRFGAIHGVIHAAGAPGDGLIQRKTGAAAAQVLAPKVQGALTLAQALRDVPLDWMMLCSSLTAITGGLGQVDYCAANAFLDAFAAARTQRDGAFTVAINWDSWRETGMAVDAVQRLRPTPMVAALPTPTGVQKTVSHPLFVEGWIDGEGQACYISRFRVDEQWVLHEHRLLGQATLPATAYLELARAAFAELTQQTALEMRELFLLQPLVVADDAQVEVHTNLTPVGDAWQVVIQSYDAAVGWREHARGEIVATPGLLPLAHPLPMLPTQEMSVDRPNRYVEAGPRWQTFVAQRIDPTPALPNLGRGQEGVARFALPLAFVADLADYHLHPGLLDGATNFLTQVLGDAYLPFAYQQIRVYRPLTPTLISTMRLVDDPQSGGNTRSFDILLTDEQGNALVEITGYRLRKFTPSSPPAQSTATADREIQNPKPVLSQANVSKIQNSLLPHGLTTAEGIEVFRRVLAHPFTQVVVSTQDLAGEIERANQGDWLTDAALAASEPEIAVSAKKGRPAMAQAYVAPRTELEARIAQVWEAFLGVAPVGAEDDFFAFGGDSLMAIQITGRLSAALHQKISPNQFLSAPTVAALAALLAQPAEASTAAATPHSVSLIKLHSGNDTRRPLFLIHPVGGSIYHYRHLAQNLGADQPVYAIQSPGLEGEQPPLTTVAEMARHYLALLSQVQPDGPYQLGGWSLGGLVAFAMAQELQARGQTATVTMIDTFYPVTPDAPITDAQYAAHFARYMGDVVGKEFDLAVEALARGDAEDRVQLIVTEGRRRGILPTELATEQIRQRLAVYTANFRAMDNYTPQPYSGAVTFLASTDSVQRSGERTLGWARVLTGALTVAELPGNHYSIIDSPALHSALRAYLV